MASFSFFLVLFIIAITTFIIWVVYVILQNGKPLERNDAKPLSTLVVLGSSGHTAEILNRLSALHKERLMPRFYVAAATDSMSLIKARVFENSLNEKSGIPVGETAKFIQIYRSREVGQSYMTSIGTTLIARPMLS